MKNCYLILLLAGGALQLVSAFLLFRLKEKDIPAIEKFPRLKLPGCLIGLAALLLCVPHAKAVSPDFLVPLLYPLAIVIPVLSYFFLDYCMARAVGGAMILWSYYWLWSSFALDHPAMALIAPAAWLWGGIGIWFSGRPSDLRDWLRNCSRQTLWRRGSGIAFIIFALWSIIAALSVAGGRS